MTDLRVTTTESGVVASVTVISQNGEQLPGGGGGAVDSVNGHTGVVVLAASDVGAQPVDSDLTAIAALATTTFGRALLALADGPAVRAAIGAGTSSFDGTYGSLTGKPTLGTAAAQPTTAFDAAGAAAAAQAASQPLDSDLTAIAALATTTFGRSLLTQADAAAVRTLIGAGTSSLALGTSSSTAKAGDYQPAAANISDASAIGKTILTAADAAAVRAAIGAGTSSFDGTYASLTGKPTLGTAAPLDVPASGDATSGQVVKGSDTRLANSRTPSAHAASHASAGSDPLTLSESQVTNLTTDLAAKVPTSRQVNGHALSADVTLDESDIAPATPNDQTGTTYTFVLADGRRMVTASNAAAQTYTVPPNSSVAYPLGTVLTVLAKGAGQVTLAPGAGVTLNSAHGLKTSAQWATVSLTKILTDTWAVSGDTTT